MSHEERGKNVKKNTRYWIHRNFYKNDYYWTIMHTCLAGMQTLLFARACFLARKLND